MRLTYIKNYFNRINIRWDMGVYVVKNFMKKSVGLWTAKSDCIPVLICKNENITNLQNFMPRQYLFLNIFHAPSFHFVIIDLFNSNIIRLYVYAWNKIAKIKKMTSYLRTGRDNKNVCIWIYLRSNIFSFITH